MELLAESRLPTEFGEFELYVLEVGGEQAVMLRYGEIAKDTACLVRIHSQCFTGESLHSLKCDCHDQLALAMKMVVDDGNGVIVYLFQEGRGIGLVEKIKAYALQDKGMDTVEANIALGHEVDARDFTIAVKILKEMQVTSARLLTNNPEKVRILEDAGLTVERVPLEIVPNTEDEGYLKTKKSKLGHLLDKV